eukprot:gnl/TRDRNA2_/TRDRNA2_130445_c0_seq1.p1 gnl/TRDRNA2_/TRDRNA2_130445_c0~~gnl/TRDRNA2_/TRDRNA2_130445_c0_seq1.p1  ORF type:complete len:257 (-),score=50.75 gnl/TRDRNA2_/TRDRNA2_130445_c0_seq1:68-766(-)
MDAVGSEEGEVPVWPAWGRGVKVTVIGLEHDPSLHNKIASILRFNPLNGKFQAKIISSGEMVQLSPENLRLASQQEVLTDMLSNTLSRYEPSGIVEVRAGCEFKYVLQLEVGQKLSWKFNVIDPNPGDASGLVAVFRGLGWSTTAESMGWLLPKEDPALRFACFAHWLDDNGNLDESDEVIVPATMVSMSDGEVEGDIEVSTTSMLVLCWDNCHSETDSQSMTYTISMSYIL